MKPYKLTDEEIIKYASRDSTYCDLSVKVGKWAAKRCSQEVMELKRS